jgi:hypothetical protein
MPVSAVAAEVLGADPGASLIGRRIGVYEIVSPLAAGGMGEVYRARDTQLGRDVGRNSRCAGCTSCSTGRTS